MVRSLRAARRTKGYRGRPHTRHECSPCGLSLRAQAPCHQKSSSFVSVAQDIITQRASKPAIVLKFLLITHTCNEINRFDTWYKRGKQDKESFLTRMFSRKCSPSPIILVWVTSHKVHCVVSSNILPLHTRPRQIR